MLGGSPTHGISEALQGNPAVTWEVSNKTLRPGWGPGPAAGESQSRADQQPGRCDSKVTHEQTRCGIGIRLLRNDGGHYHDVTAQSGIINTSLSYGLAAGIADVDGDGWPDIYISNDYNVPDRLYINDGKGRFSDRLQKHLGHTSFYSMGNDIADINNDLRPDIYTLDMLPEDNRRQKLLMDWSWAPLFADYDNDGWKDLFVTNGYTRDYTNMDFLKFAGDNLKDRNVMRQDLLELVKHMPSSQVKSYLYRNNRNGTLTDVSSRWGISTPSNSNGAAYADLDNDGELDLVVNNINQNAFVYENLSNTLTDHHFLELRLNGGDANTRGIGAKVYCYTASNSSTWNRSLPRGFNQVSVQCPTLVWVPPGSSIP